MRAVDGAVRVGVGGAVIGDVRGGVDVDGGSVVRGLCAMCLCGGGGAAASAGDPLGGVGGRRCDCQAS